MAAVSDNRMDQTIEVGFQTFLSDGPDPFGAVRALRRGREGLVVSVQNAGDFVVPLDAVKAVEKGTVTFDCNKIDKTLRRAIEGRHTADGR